MLRLVFAAAGAVVFAAALFVPSPARAADGNADALAAQILAEAGRTKGFCADLGCGSGELALAIAGKSEMFVHALATDETSLSAARAKLGETDLYGRRLAVEAGSLDRLPYPDYCANLIVRGDLMAGGAGQMSWKEVHRVLQPGGLAWIGQSASVAAGGAKLTGEALRAQLQAAGIKTFEIVTTGGVWAKIRRDRPKGMGDWGHSGRGGPDNTNCADDDLVRAPFQTLWINGPRSFTKYGWPLIANGRVLLRHGGMPYEDSRWKAPNEPDLVQVFDAYNGIMLWQKRLPERLGADFVAAGEQVFAVAGTNMHAFNAADGAVLWKKAPAEAAAGMKDWSEYWAADGVLVAGLLDADRDTKSSKDNRPRKALVGIQAATGKVLWTVSNGANLSGVALAEGAAFFTVGGKQIEAVELATGKRRWSKPSQGGGTLKYHQGELYGAGGVYSAADGTYLRRADIRGIIVGDRVLAGSFKGMSARDLKTGSPAPCPKPPRDPYCPKTGVPDGCSFMYGRCIRSNASNHCFFINYGGTVIADLIRNELFPAESFRSNCRTGVIAGSGVVYNSPSGCSCSFAVRGQAAMVPVDEAFYWAKPESSPPPRLEKGPAFGQPVTASAAPGDWPCFRHDAARSNVSPAALAAPLSQTWKAKLPAGITPPAVAGGVVFVGCDDHAVYALDAATGERKWSFRTGGEVWNTPAWSDGRLYVGSQDGWVYCLRASDGALIWRFRGGPHERKMFYQGRPQSLWPIGGGVIVDKGVAYFYAGLCGYDRVFVHAVDAATGKSIWMNEKAGRAVDVTGPEGGISPHGLSPTGTMAASDDTLYIPHGMFAPSAFRRSDGKLLWWARRGDSKTRSNIEVQNIGGAELMVGGGFLFVGGRGRVPGSAQTFTAVDAKTGRFWGSEDPRLFAKAGRDETGKVVEVKKARFGTKPIGFGNDMAPVLVDGGIFTQGYRATLLDLPKYLQTQFGDKPANMNLWPGKQLYGMVTVAGDKVLLVGGKNHKVEVLARADGRTLWSGQHNAAGEVMPNGTAVGGGKVFIVTRTGEVVCLGGK